MRPTSLVAAVAAALGTAPALAAPPTAPSDLRVDVYSGTAAELFWSRSTDPDGAVRGYEIRRDGMLVETRDGLSYFTDSLTDGRAFAFTVTAVDFDGERSAPASVSVVGGDRDGAVGAGGGRPPPPANLTSAVYSSSAAEVFWDRSDQPGLSYEVSVDGGPVTTTDGTSAFLSGLDGARGRGVDVVAIDANGQRSGAANVVTLGGGNPNPPTGGGGGGSDVPAPSSLRAELYSGSAGEVFWDRVPGASLSYEVRLDGEAVATTTGTSYFVGDRPGLDGTSVEVVAIGPDGTRSSASSTTLGSGDGVESGPPLSAPANLRAEVYSATAAELFWDRASPELRYEVRRDEESIATTDGTSYFDDALDGGREYRYEVVASDATGRRSDASSVALVTPAVSAGTPNPPPPASDPTVRIDIADFADGSERGFVIERNLGVRPLGDVTGDGLADLLVDAGQFGGYVLPGRPSGYDGTVDPRDTVRTGGFRAPSAGPAGGLGGDFNGDGIADALGSTRESGNSSERAGRFWILYGRDGGFRDYAGVDEIAPGEGAVFAGFAPDQDIGATLSGLGDLDGDGADEVATLGGSTFDGAAGVYIVYGGAALPSRLELGQIERVGVRIAPGGPQSGTSGVTLRSVRALGDIDGDGLDDVGIAYEERMPDPISGGAVGRDVTLVLYGRAGERIDLPAVDAPLEPGEGFRLFGDGSVSSVGDIDGDGTDDLAFAGDGENLLLVGPVRPDTSELSVEELAERVAVTPVRRLPDAVGDVDGSGRTDVVVPFDRFDPASPEDAIAYLSLDPRVSGDLDGEAGVPSRIDVLIDWSGEDARRSLSEARRVGDVNGDGLDDILLDVAGRDGTALVYGSREFDRSP